MINSRAYIKKKKMMSLSVNTFQNSQTFVASDVLDATIIS